MSTQEWPGIARLTGERPDVSRAIEWPETYGCPHCMSRVPTCHVCDGVRRVSFDALVKAMGSIWAKRACVCAACEALRDE
jgi:hypothetical protein